MKNSKLMGTILISLSFLTFSVGSASAFPHGNERHAARSADNFWSKREDDKRGKGDDGRGGDDRGSGVSLPINKQSWFLLVAGLGIGSCVILSKTKLAR